MKRLIAILAVLVAAAAALMIPVGATDPPTVTVARGDTLGKIAKANGVSLADLRSWNGIDGDLIQVGQVLKLGESGPGEPLWQLLADRFAGAPEPEPEVVADAPAGPKRKRARKAPQGGAPPPEYVEEEPTSWPPLKPPAPKECLDPFAGVDGGGDHAFGRSEGLSGKQVKVGVSAFQQQTLRCADGHDSIAGGMTLELTIGCDGRVLKAEVIDDAIPADGFADCVAQVMTFASFPAHARDEVTVQVPLSYTD